MKKNCIYFIFLLLLFNNLFSFSHTFGEKQDDGTFVGYHRKMALPNTSPSHSWRIYFTNEADTTQIRKITLREYFDNSILNDINLLNDYPFITSTTPFADSAAFHQPGSHLACGVLIRVNSSITGGNALMTCTAESDVNINAEPASDFMITVYTSRIKKAIEEKEKVNIYTLFRHEMLHGMGLGHSEDPNDIMAVAHKNRDIAISQDAKNGLASWYFPPKFVESNNTIRKIIRGKYGLKVEPVDPAALSYSYNVQIGLDDEDGLPSLTNNYISIDPVKSVWDMNMNKPWYHFGSGIPDLGEHTVKLFAQGSENSRVKKYKYFYKENANDSIKIDLYDFNVNKPKEDEIIKASEDKAITIKFNKKDKNGSESDLDDLNNYSTMKAKIHLMRD